MNSRIVIEQAKGAIAQAHVVSVDAAFNALRAYARSNSRRLSDITTIIVTDRTALPNIMATRMERGE